MRNYLLVTVALFFGCVGASLLGLNLLGAALFPVPIVAYLIRGQTGRAAGLLACAAAAALVVTAGAVSAAVYYVLVAGVGFPLGIGIARRWTYGLTVTVVTVWIYGLMAASVLMAWDLWLAEAEQTYTALIAQVQDQARDMNVESADLLVRNITWLKDHWAEIGLGLLLWPALAEVCLGVTLLAAWLRRRLGVEGFQGSFRTMRVSEWLVWSVIGVAGLCAVEYRWPNSVLQLVVWNAACALAAIYWLNGFSILVFAVDALRPHVLVYVGVFAMLIWFPVHPVLCFVGLFDTWVDFRKKVDALIEARRRREESKDKE